MEFHRKDVPLYFVGAAAVTTLVSIRVFEILMAAALIALIVTRRRWRIPPVWLPLSLFVLGTSCVAVCFGAHSRGPSPGQEILRLPDALSSDQRHSNGKEIRWMALVWAFARRFRPPGRC